MDYVTYNNSASTPTAPVSANAQINWLNLTGDGTLYAQNADTTSTSYQILRCLNITAPEQYITWVGLAGTLPGATNAGSNFGNNPVAGPPANVNLQPASQSVGYNSTGKFDLITQIIINTANGTTQNGYPAMIEKFTDTMVLKPVVTAPAPDAQLGTSFSIGWNAVPAGSNTVTYKVDIATDNGFNGIVVSKTTNATSAFIAPSDNLVQGTKYYLRVSSTLPYPSNFSATQAFSIRLGVTGNENLAGMTRSEYFSGTGAINVPVNANFQWASITGASTYHIQVADNPSFTNPIADATTAATFFTLPSPLNPGTVYYWRVQAISGQIASDYVSNVFTTAVPAAPTSATTAPAPAQTVQPTIIVTVPPSTPAPVSTPAYVWVIIVIGAILVIAVVVLIARTRRV